MLAALSLSALSLSQGAEPLRIFIRSGPKTHGPGQHDHPRFMEDWVKLLNQRGAKATGKMGFPSAQELENTDVLVMYLAKGGTISPEDRTNLDKFLKRGGELPLQVRHPLLQGRRFGLGRRQWIIFPNHQRGRRGQAHDGERNRA